jgi:hypothetical protein
MRRNCIFLKATRNIQKDRPEAIGWIILRKLISQSNNFLLPKKSKTEIAGSSWSI